MRAYFGESFDFLFYPLKSDFLTQKVDLPSAPTSVYLFDGKPSNTDAANGTSSSATLIHTINAWAATTDTFGKKITIPVVPDPDPNGDVFEYDYYLAINTKVNASDTSDQAPIIKSITLSRLRAQEGRIIVNEDDLTSVCPAVIKFVCTTALQTYIDAAIIKVRENFQGLDTSFADIVNPSLLKNAVVYRALFSFFFDQSKGQGSMEYAQCDRWQREYADQMKLITVEVKRHGNTDKVKVGGAKKYFGSISYYK